MMDASKYGEIGTWHQKKGDSGGGAAMTSSDV